MRKSDENPEVTRMAVEESIGILTRALGNEGLFGVSDIDRLKMACGDEVSDALVRILDGWKDGFWKCFWNARKAQSLFYKGQRALPAIEEQQRYVRAMLGLAKIIAKGRDYGSRRRWRE